MTQESGECVLIMSMMFGGKCLGENTPVLMFNGTIKNVQDIVIGDKLMGDDSTPREVLSTTSGRSMLYEIIPSWGDSYFVNENHMLSLKCSFSRNKKYVKGNIIDISVKDFLQESAIFQSFYKGYRVPVEFKHKDVQLDPYILGTWLGDGTSSAPAISNIDDQILEYWREYFKTKNLLMRRRTCNQVDTISYYVSTGINTRGGNWFLNQLRTLKVLNNKHIPKKYKANSREIRLKLLAGLIDTDGFYDKDLMKYEIMQKRRILAEDICFVAKSLGMVSYVNETKKGCWYLGEYREGIYYRVYIGGKASAEIPCLLERKKSARKNARNNLLVGIKIKETEEGDYYGFELDGNGRFLLGDFTVTHNSSYLFHLLETFGRATRCLYINSSTDNRTDDVFSTHNTILDTKRLSDNLNADMVKVSNLEQISDEFVSKYKVVCIDEAQFYPDLDKQVRKWVDILKLEVYVAGLSGDYKRRNFGQVHELLPFANQVIMLRDTLCEDCSIKGKRTSALFTHRKNDETKSQVEVGNSNYKPLCRECFLVAQDSVE